MSVSSAWIAALSSGNSVSLSRSRASAARHAPVRASSSARRSRSARSWRSPRQAYSRLSSRSAACLASIAPAGKPQFHRARGGARVHRSGRVTAPAGRSLPVPRCRRPCASCSMRARQVEAGVVLARIEQRGCGGDFAACHQGLGRQRQQAIAHLRGYSRAATAGSRRTCAAAGAEPSPQLRQPHRAPQCDVVGIAASRGSFRPVASSGRCASSAAIDASAALSGDAGFVRIVVRRPVAALRWPRRRDRARSSCARPPGAEVRGRAAPSSRPPLFRCAGAASVPAPAEREIQIALSGQCSELRDPRHPMPETKRGRHARRRGRSRCCVARNTRVSEIGSTTTPCQVGSSANSADRRRTGTPCPSFRCVPTSRVAPVSGSASVTIVPGTAADRTRRSSVRIAGIDCRLGAGRTAVMRQTFAVCDSDSAAPGSSGTRSTVAVGRDCTLAEPNTGSSRNAAVSISCRWSNTTTAISSRRNAAAPAGALNGISSTESRCAAGGAAASLTVSTEAGCSCAIRSGGIRR